MAGRVEPAQDISTRDLQNDAPGGGTQFAGKRNAATAAANASGNTAPGNAPPTQAELRAETYVARWTVPGSSGAGQVNVNGLARDMECVAKEPGAQAIIDAVKKKLTPGDKTALTCHLASGENYPASWTGALGNASGMTCNWATGTGAADRTFGPRTDASADMRNAPGVERARNYFYKKNAQNIAAGKPLDPVTNYKAYFGLKGLRDSGLSPTQQYVGSFSVNITPVNKNGCGYLRFEISNDSSLKSFLYGIGPEYERSSFGPAGNMRQTYWWEESVR